MHPHFYVNAVPKEVPDSAADEAEPGQPGEFFRQYKERENEFVTYLLDCEDEIAAGKSRDELVRELDELRQAQNE